MSIGDVTRGLTRKALDQFLGVWFNIQRTCSQNILYICKFVYEKIITNLHKLDLADGINLIYYSCNIIA